MTDPSEEQDAVINAPITPMAVIACAGSGKTYTAVRRLARMRQLLGAARGRVALLSFSNVAVETFRREYTELARASAAGDMHDRVEIATLDGFLATNVLRSHAHRSMGCSRSAFLVTGSEAFLVGLTFPGRTYPRGVTELQVGNDSSGIYFFYRDNDTIARVDRSLATRLVERLGRAGGYTHDLGRYWCHRLLTEEPAILRALVRRYPHILIDEAQDIGTLHQAIIEQLIAAGCQVSLIGDPHQGIYDFAGANGAFLRAYDHRQGVLGRKLSVNYRATPPLVALARSLGGRNETADRGAPDTPHGAFFIPYNKADYDHVITTFERAIVDAGLELSRSAVLCRGRDLADRLGGRTGAPGQGAVRLFAQAAIQRDRFSDYNGAFRLALRAFIDLIANPPDGLASQVTSAIDPQDQALRRLFWAFTRNCEEGLPAVTHAAATHWHTLLVARVKRLLAAVEDLCGLTPVATLGNRLAKRGLTDAPLVAPADLVAGEGTKRIRVDTVHQTKGESLDAVLYLASREHVEALLSGVDTELGRIGYVAATRARNLFWLGVPRTAVAALRVELSAQGVNEVAKVIASTVDRRTPPIKKSIVKSSVHLP